MEHLEQLPEAAAASGESDGEPGAEPNDDAAPTLRLEMAERVAAHRRRKASHVAAHRAAVANGIRQAQPGRAVARHHKIAAAVADRYAQTPSYRAFLAEEAERAIQQATAAAEVAARNAVAVAEAQRQLLDELARWDKPQEFSRRTARVAATAEVLELPDRELSTQDLPAEALPTQETAAPVRELSTAGLTVRLYEDVGRSLLPERVTSIPAPDADEALALDEEIAFRQSPSFEDFGMHADPPQPLPANLLEFPRQLVAARKARPRLAEGPLLEEERARNPQLRIFEVTPEQVSAVPMVASVAPEWSTIFLDAHVAAPFEVTADALAPMLPPQTAPVARRTMAAAVDGGLVLAGAMAFAGTSLRVAGRMAANLPLGLALAATLVAFWALYQVLFFTFSDQTPGMRYARIGLCTLSDENPTRRAMRRRLWAQALAVAPLGLGLVWVLLDEDRLGWHDRLSRMYQRAY